MTNFFICLEITPTHVKLREEVDIDILSVDTYM